MIPGCQADANVRPMWVQRSNVFSRCPFFESATGMRPNSSATCYTVEFLGSDGLIGTGTGNYQNMGTVWELTMKAEISASTIGISHDFSNISGNSNAMGIQ